jgi:hypothetical protein
MSMSNDDLNWLAAQRPARSGTDKDAHDRALLSLLRHATARPPVRRERRSFAGLLNTRVLAVATAAGAAAIAAAVLLSANAGTKALTTNHSVASQALHAARPHASRHSSLIRLADNLSTTNAGSGDATLIQRTTHTGGQNITVYDLYGDNGTYYFSQSEGGLPAQVSSNNSQADGLFAREVAAAKQAATGDVAQAGVDLANAPDPNRQQLVTPTNDGTGLSPAAETKLAQAKDKLLGVKYTPGSLYDNYTWEDAQDAMIAGAGDPQVRAGVLKILATLPGVSVTQGSTGGTPTLVLTAGSQEFGMNYSEQLTIDAETGMPIGFVGGAPGDPGDTTVDYQVRRVALSSVATGTNLPSF